MGSHKFEKASFFKIGYATNKLRQKMYFETGFFVYEYDNIETHWNKIVFFTVFMVRGPPFNLQGGGGQVFF